MSPRITLAVALRVLTQLRRDPRTVALLLIVPTVLIVLLWWMFEAQDETTFDRIGPALLAIFPFTVMFLVASVTTLRERSSGTLERLLTMPMAKLDLILGYALAFGMVTVVQSILTVTVSLTLLDLQITGSIGLLLVVTILDAILGTVLGLLVSAFSATEFQAVQFMPALVIPQILLCGLIVPRERLPGVLSRLSDVLPLSYATDAMDQLTRTAETGQVWADLAVVAGFAVVLLVLGAATLRRRTP